jgi:hypothetical protein
MALILELIHAIELPPFLAETKRDHRSWPVRVQELEPFVQSFEKSSSCEIWLLAHKPIGSAPALLNPSLLSNGP